MNKKIKFLNKIPKQFCEDEKYIKDTIIYYFNEMKFESKVSIKFIDYIKTNEYEITDCMVKNEAINKQELIITNSLLKSINRDGGDFFCLSIYHEFKHIEDFVNMMNTNLFDFKLCLAHQKNFERQYVSTGFLFWTEIYAYYKTINLSNINNLKYEKITFGRLVENFNKTIALDKKFYNKKDLSYEEGLIYINSVKSFIYLCAKFMASVYAGHSRVPYSRIEKNKQYKKVCSILAGLEPKIKRLIKNPYNEKSYLNLYKLGKHICENLQWKVFKVGLIKSKGSITTFY